MGRPGGEPNSTFGNMIRNPKFLILTEAILCSLGLMVFSYFIHHPFPVRLFSFAALLPAAYIIGKNVKTIPDLKKITGDMQFPKTGLLWSLVGITGGILFAVLYRWYLEIPVFPESIYVFALFAALIGSLEELVFRGFIQEHVKSLNGPLSILFSTVAHTGYKCCLFLSPMVLINTDIGFLAFWTFLAGSIFGSIRHFSGSIIPSLVAHAIFDIVVYAEFLSAPWWVW
jgi:membrane protease YdiL (CAAX protease family)